MRPFLGLILLTGCTDLPDGWEDATPVASLTQSECGASPYDTGFVEAATATQEAAAVRVTYDPVHFRCAQDLAGFFKQDGDHLDVLVQPKDMNPSTVAKCDCGYVVDVEVPSTDAASLTAWRRWDSLGGERDPFKVVELSLP